MNQAALDNAQQLHPDLWSIQGLIQVDELQEILNRLSQEKSWEKVDLQEYSPREQLTWQENGLCDWLFGKLETLDFSRFDLSLRTVIVWRDHAGYIIKNHYDNDRVFAAMQVYLSDSYPVLGTWFEDTIEIPFVQNTGYLMHNRNRLIHGMKAIVPEDYTRFSFYVLFDKGN